MKDTFEIEETAEAKQTSSLHRKRKSVIHEAPKSKFFKNNFEIGLSCKKRKKGF